MLWLLRLFFEINKYMDCMGDERDLILGLPPSENEASDPAFSTAIHIKSQIARRYPFFSAQSLLTAACTGGSSLAMRLRNHVPSFGRTWHNKFERRAPISEDAVSSVENEHNISTLSTLCALGFGMLC